VAGGVGIVPQLELRLAVGMFKNGTFADVNKRNAHRDRADDDPPETASP
jgi:hypothetical protein